ncbi:MAG: hypothetical protein A3A58_03390 [Candidatus Blackburnbacteria bacterium RIFCSPLOWO2_01_FULL_41_27]|uniref:Uncharacterized protein n=2 Tax=Candidatus Blackburniibacteriota TaxID=1817898 RepID=A0A1G1V8C5_9BACT|nr:MAG: hypothetical protein A3F61_01830 [Candidatus Blackburnbacteria bacterium RIFCSPHIGHO2_12_FULL_41_13b]OGY13254.1 MAG: hypothetical protein A3A58_03390 [Candidatus Blackburnbacteria bacterium RIFCSPLOWO2_01_FULL_41_27]
MAVLTKSDLDQIRKVVREEVEVEVTTATRNLQIQILQSRIEARTDNKELKEHAKTTEILARGSERRLTKLEAKIDKNHKEIKEEIKQVSDFLDKENLKAVKRVKRVEEHLSLPPLSQN